ncbi:MAG: CinA family protein [Actinomycetaceae bacterium]|nr:CinA family protein [Actinomycetaceae bacterium]
MWNTDIKQAATKVIEALGKAPETIATAESLTGGLLSAALTMVPGASNSMRGGVTTYATAAKNEVLGVNADLLSHKGAVDPEVAAQMAEHVRDLFNSDWALATTGVAGPETQDGKPVGTVYIALTNDTETVVKECHFQGTRDEIRAATVLTSLNLFLEVYEA